MAIVRSGLLGGFSGKIAGIVGGKWKDKQYARGYVVPANPNTPKQQAKRLRFKTASVFGLSILGGILQPYMDWCTRSMSAFNWFIKTNIALFVDIPVYTSIKVASGSLFSAAIGTPSNSGQTVTVPFDMGLGSNGLASDKVYAGIYDKASGRTSFASAEVLRLAGAISVTMGGTTSTDVCIFLITARRDAAGNVVKVGNSDAMDYTLT